MNCNKCNTPLEGPFCSVCGAPAAEGTPAPEPLEQPVVPPPPGYSAPPPQPVAGQMPVGSYGAPAQPGAQQPAGYGMPQQQPVGTWQQPVPGQMPVQPVGGYPMPVPPAKKKGKTVAIVMVAVVVVIGIVFAIFAATFGLFGSVDLPSRPVGYRQFYTAAENSGFEVLDLTDLDEEKSYLLAVLGDSRVDHFECLNEMAAIGAYFNLEEIYEDYSSSYKSMSGNGYALYSGKNGNARFAVLRMENTIVAIEAEPEDLDAVNELLEQIGLADILL